VFPQLTVSWRTKRLVALTLDNRFLFLLDDFLDGFANRTFPTILYFLDALSLLALTRAALVFGFATLVVLCTC
jgi:hypothetical protein